MILCALNSWDAFAFPEIERFGYDLHEKIAYADSEDPYQILNLAVPRGRKNFPSVIWFHGGGFTGDQSESPTGLYDGNVAIAEVRYRLSPEHIAPAQHQDAAAAISWVRRHIAEYGGDEKNIFVGGLSAGAYLAAITVFDPEYLAPYGMSDRDIRGMLLISGQMTTHFQVKLDLNYPGENLIPAVDRYAPMAYLRKTLPPILMVVGDHDMDLPGRTYENRFMADLLICMGHPHIECYALEGHGHGTDLQNPVLMRKFMQRVLDNTPIQSNH